MRLRLFDLLGFGLWFRFGFRLHVGFFDRQRNGNLRLLGLHYVRHDLFRLLERLRLRRRFRRRDLFRFGWRRLLLRRFGGFRLDLFRHLFFHRRFRLRRKLHHHRGHLRTVGQVFFLRHVDCIGPGGVNRQDENARADPAPRIMPEGMMVNIGGSRLYRGCSGGRAFIARLPAMPVQ